MNFKTLAFLLLIPISVSAQIKHGLRDTQGRHVIPRGFVVNTNDHKGEVFLIAMTILEWLGWEQTLK